MRRALLIAAVLTCSTAFADFAPEQEARYRALIAELRCLVCQNQSIAESNAPLAGDLRDQVAAQITAGKSDREIIDYLTARYGDFVLYRPPVKSNTLLLWLAPGVLVIAGVGIVLHRARRRGAVAAAPVDEAKLQKLLQSAEEPKR